MYQALTLNMSLKCTTQKQLGPQNIYKTKSTMNLNNYTNTVITFTTLHLTSFSSLPAHTHTVMFHNANVGCRETEQLLSPSAHCTTEIYPQNAQGTGSIHAKQSQESTSA